MGKLGETTQCENCGKDYTRKSGSQKYCKREACVEDRKDRKNEKKKCKGCKKKFKPASHRHSYCNDCMKKRGKTYKTRRDTNHFYGPPPRKLYLKECNRCGEHYLGHRRFFCSDFCWDMQEEKYRNQIS